VTRIEIMRGCRMNCPFCQLTATKPYRELPAEVIKRLILKAESRKVNLVCADFWSHSQADEIEEFLMKSGKHNTGQDLRLDMAHKAKYAQSGRLRFGIEAFGERVRKKTGKIGSNDSLLRKMKDAFTRIKSKKGKPVSVATVYMIAGLPGETPKDVGEFGETIKRLDEWAVKEKRKITLFLSVAGFAPAAMTPMELDSVDIHQDWAGALKKLPRYHNVVIAHRGGVTGPAARMCQLLTIRGDERAARLVSYIGRNKMSWTASRKERDEQDLLKGLRQCGIEPKELWKRYNSRDELPHRNIQDCINGSADK